MKKRKLIIFIKSPLEGQVKTRLAAELGKEFAVEAYLAMAADLIRNLAALQQEMQFCINDLRGASVLFERVSSLLGLEHRVLHSLSTPGGPPLDFVQAGDVRIPIKQQNGADLGLKMKNAFEDAFADGTEAAILIGSDIPQLSSALIEDYFGRLDESPMVLGPADDGGYFLIGFKRNFFAPQVLEQIEWSTDRVLYQTTARAKSAGLSFSAGTSLYDIDTLDDLLRLAADRKVVERVPFVLDVVNHKRSTDAQVFGNHSDS